MQVSLKNHKLSMHALHIDPTEGRRGPRAPGDIEITGCPLVSPTPSVGLEAEDQRSDGTTAAKAQQQNQNMASLHGCMTAPRHAAQAGAHSRP